MSKKPEIASSLRFSQRRDFCSSYLCFSSLRENRPPWRLLRCSLRELLAKTDGRTTKQSTHPNAAAKTSQTRLYFTSKPLRGCDHPVLSGHPSIEGNLKPVFARNEVTKQSIRPGRSGKNLRTHRCRASARRVDCFGGKYNE